MSSTKTVLVLIAREGLPPTYDEMLAATGLSRHQLSNILNRFKHDEMLVVAPERFSITQRGRAEVERIAAQQAERKRLQAARAAAKKRAKRVAASNVVRITPGPVARPASCAPNSVFDLAKFA